MSDTNLATRLIRKAVDLNRSTHRRKVIHQWEHQEICKEYLIEHKITQDDYDQIINAMGWAVIKL